MRHWPGGKKWESRGVRFLRGVLVFDGPLCYSIGKVAARVKVLLPLPAAAAAAAAATTTGSKV